MTVRMVFVPNPPESVTSRDARSAWQNGYAAFLNGRARPWGVGLPPCMDEWAHGWLQAHSETMTAVMESRSDWTEAAILLTRFKVRFNEVMTHAKK